MNASQVGVSGEVTRSNQAVRGLDLQREFRAMTSDINMWIVDPKSHATSALDAAQDVFRRVEAACTRFESTSPLMQANVAGRHWRRVPRECVDAVAEAAKAHRVTGGLFDPRVLGSLQRIGYSASLPFEAGSVSVSSTATAHGNTERRVRVRWKPGVSREQSAVRIGRVPIDLGGIGKGLAVRWAAAELRLAGRASLIQAGGDCYADGHGLDGEGWSIAVEDPFGASEPIAVLRLSDCAVATSSLRLRRWVVDGRAVHHLIDPRTGSPADSGLVAVTVVDADPAMAEVWSKALFVAGRGELRRIAVRHKIAALWVDEDGRVSCSRAMRPYLLWQAIDVD